MKTASLLVALTCAGVARAYCQDPCPSPRASHTRQAFQVWTQSPVYGTGSGWVYGTVTDTLQQGASIEICEERRIGIPGATQRWLRIRWAGHQGWIYGENTVDVSMRAHGIYLMLVAFDSRPAPASWMFRNRLRRRTR